MKKQNADKSINILTWGGMIDPKNAKEFEKKTGIKVNINYYETNDELASKIQISKNKQYDLITITNNVFDFFKKNDLIKKMDKTKLNFVNDIDEHLIGFNFDPNYDYSIPLFWDVFGLGINTSYFADKVPEASWDLIFDKKNIPAKVGMTDEAINAVLIASQYLFGETNLNKERLQKIKELLLQQKKFVEIYTDFKGDLILQNGTCPVVASQSAYIYKPIKDNNKLKFLIPKEGGFLIINLVVIPKLSHKDEYVYQFLNFINQKDIVKKHFYNFGYLPIQKHLLYSINLNHLNGINHIFSPEIFSKFSLFEPNINVNQINEIWTEIKA